MADHRDGPIISNDIGAENFREATSTFTITFQGQVPAPARDAGFVEAWVFDSGRSLETALVSPAAQSERDSFFFHRIGEEGSPAEVRGDISKDGAGVHIDLDILSAIGGSDVCWVVTGGLNSPVDLDIRIGMSHTTDFIV